MMVSCRNYKVWGLEEGNFSESPHVIKRNPIMQFVLKCQFGLSKVDRRMG